MENRDTLAESLSLLKLHAVPRCRSRQETGGRGTVRARRGVIAIVKMTTTPVLDQFYARSALTVRNEALAPARLHLKRIRRVSHERRARPPLLFAILTLWRGTYDN